jgi:hypothetical protein
MSKMMIRLVRLKRLLRASGEYAPADKETTVKAEVQRIIDALPLQPAEDQQDILAALYYLGVMPDRRTGRDRRAGQPVAPEVLERRTGQDRRQARDLGRWLDGSV